MKISFLNWYGFSKYVIVKLKFGFIIYLLLTSANYFAQTPIQPASHTSQRGINKPVGKFLSDSIGIGLKVAYSLSYKHPADQTILFPDSTFNFFPFELIEKVYYPTRTQNQQSTDSVVYFLTTFETRKVLPLQLPVYWVQGKDSLLIWAEKDSVFLQELVKGNPAKLKLRTETNYYPTEELFDYPLLITVIISAFLLLLLIWLFLGKHLIKTFLLYQFRTRHNRFLREFTRLMNKITEQQSTKDITKALALWKKHLEYLEQRPFSSYTSKEIAREIPDNRLITSLKNIDKVIYGGELSEDIESSLQFLRSFSNFRFEQKQEQLRQGKT
ncbi:MAG: hypothetical protein NZ551_00750 [Microscillaceae bacterium]|nr:hypothetical protein [Microscillaceae bacterium]MDW8459717.1 hypothetical protein [Cytophagales bacterium]